MVVVTGVAGSGKSTVGRALALRLQWRFHDADDLHSEDNRERMRHGVALDDEQREPWLLRVRDVIEAAIDDGAGAVIACSALKERYRVTISTGLPRVRFVFLDADRDLLLERLSERQGHYAGPSLLDSQLAALEPPQNALRVDASQPIDVIVEAIITDLEQRSRPA